MHNCIYQIIKLLKTFRKKPECLFCANDAHLHEDVVCRKRPRSARECVKHILLYVICLIFCVIMCIIYELCQYGTINNYNNM